MGTMKNAVRALLLAGMAALAGSGCASLSLFSSEHRHYYGGGDLEARLQTLEHRVAAFDGCQPAPK